MIPNKKGSYKTARNRFKVKVLKSVSYLLEKIIAHGEQVFRVAHGVAYFPSEIFFGNGLLTMLMNHYAIFATDRRLLFININSRITKPTHLFFQVPYENIDKIKFGKIFGSIAIKSVKGKRRTFSYMKRYLVQELKEFLDNKLSTVTTTTKAMAQPENICPACFLPVIDGQKQCPHCEAQFKTPWAAFFRSLLLPGWGDLYLGHKGLGLLELLGSLIFWGIMISLVIESMKSGDQVELMSSIIIGVAFLAFYHIGDAILTYFMGKKGYIVKK